MVIRPFEAQDIDAYVAHVIRHLGESGRGETPLFAPYSSNQKWDPAARNQESIGKFTKPLDQPGWKRAWVLDDGAKIVGRVDLSGGVSSTYSLHRASLEMGVEAPSRKRGFGQKLLEIALDWARTEPSLEWVDLNVFAKNGAAHRMYVRQGFSEIGRIEDLFRIDGESVTDISMAMRVK